MWDEDKPLTVESAQYARDDQVRDFLKQGDSRNAVLDVIILRLLDRIVKLEEKIDAMRRGFRDL